MPYCTLADVQQAAGGSERLRQLSDFESTGAIDGEVVDEAIAEAEGEINEYLQKRHNVALPDPVPEGVRRIAARHAVFLMKDDRGMVTEQDMKMLERREKRLDDIAKGIRAAGVHPLPEKSPEFIVDKSIPRPSDKQVSRQGTRGFW